MSEQLTSKIVAWAAEVATAAAELPTKQQREAYLAERRRDLADGAIAEGTTREDAEGLADVCVDAARRILTELLIQRASGSPGHA